VIHVGEMGDLMRGEIVEHERRREDETPGEGQRAARGAGAPASGLIAHIDALRLEVEAPRMDCDARLEIELRLPLEPVEQAARRMIFLAGHMQTRQTPHRDARTFGPCRRRARIFGFFHPDDAAVTDKANESDLMRETPQRHDRAVTERHGLRQTGNALLQPAEMARQEFVGLTVAGVCRHCQKRTATRFAHLQAEPPRSRAFLD
jgi:hypothetical protein